MKPGWDDGQGNFSHRYLFGPVASEITGRRRLLDLGCGDGSLTARLEAGVESATGLDWWADGLEQARTVFPKLDLRHADMAMPLPDDLRGTFDAVISVEVIEHLLLPGNLFERAREAMTPAGIFVVTTPYHSYLKNLALALTNSFDRHWDPTLDYGHVKFFSPATLGVLAARYGFRIVRTRRVGRWAPLAKSMVITFTPGG